MPSLPPLFEPLQVGSITIPNRIGMSAMSRNRTPTTVPNKVNLEYYVQRAISAGIVIAESTLVSSQGTQWPYSPGLYNNEQVEAWKKITDAVHAVGGRIFAQLDHAGRTCHPDAPGQLGRPVYGPSAVAARGGKFRQVPGAPGFVVPTPIPDPWDIIREYKIAAINAKRAGFDGVELHASHGVLISQFLDSGVNQRTDKWGGSVENRSRFGLIVLKMMAKIFTPGRVGVKVSPAGGLNDVGMPLQETIDTYNHFISEADKLGIAYITLVRYSAFKDPEFDGKKRGTPHDILATYGPLIKHAKRFLNEGVTPEEGSKLIASGAIDGIFIGFMWIAHPDLARRVKFGKPLDNKPDLKRLQGDGEGEEEAALGYTDYPVANYD